MASKAKQSKQNFLEGEFNLPQLEEKVLKFWNERKIFEKSLEKTQKGKSFTFYDGPPFATGLPHYGHILASTIKDLVPRYQTMQGRFVRRRWGWDCHGLPIEEIVERKLGISGKKQIEEVGIKKFNETCRSMVLGYVDEWRAMIRRIARWVEFDDSYKTMDVDYMESVWWGFKNIYKKDLVYEGRKVLLYCPRCETPVSNFEVAMDNSYKDVQEESVVAKFKVKSGQTIGTHQIQPDDKVYILAWTTTPWTLPGNVALAVNKKTVYEAIKHGDEYFVAAPDRLKDLDLDHGESRHQVAGLDLVGLEYEPLFEVPAVHSERAFRVYDADFVNTEDGTGIVHTAVVYGEEDYELGIRENLPIVPLLDEKGIFNKKAPELVRGIYFKKAEKIIKDDLEGRGLLLKRQQHIHSYPFCWRCGTQLFYNAIPAWFVNIQKIKKKLLESNDSSINWFPEHLKHGRYEKSVEAAPDWNISRNRYWGNPIPVWKCEKCGKVEVVGSLDELSEKAGGGKNNYWVMRHGEAESNMFDIIDSGQKKFLHLTPRGKKQAEAGANKFEKELEKRHEKLDIIIASDITRTVETAEIVSKILGVKFVTNKAIEEIHLGPMLSGYKDKKYAELFPTYASRFEQRPEGGESVRDLRQRVWSFLQDCEKKYEKKNILLVTHEYPIWAMFQAAEGWSERRAIAEKEMREKDFITFAQVQKLNLKNIPRNDTGEVDLHRPYIDEIEFACSCGGTMKRTPEIFDSWVEAGSMPFAELHYPFESEGIFKKRFPAQFVAEYIAQTRAWFYVMHVISMVLFGEAPFENVVTTGTILAEDGSKMSKSKANFPDPKLLIDKYGADSLRFYLMGSVVMQADNLNFSEKGVENAYRKVALLLLNVYKYFATYSAEQKVSDKKNKPSPGGAKLDSWIKARMDELIGIVTACLNNYDTVNAARAIQEYVDDLSTWYLRRSRKRSDEAFFGTMHESLLAVSKVIAPFMPFLAEMLYSALGTGNSGLGQKESVHLEDWPVEKKENGKRKMEKELLGQMRLVRKVASLGLAERAKAGIKVRQPLAELKVKSEMLKGKEDFLEILKDEINIKHVAFDINLKSEVELDTVITPELREEGLLRDLARMIQELRQKAGLAPKDQIAVMMVLPENVRNAVIKNEKVLKSDVGAKLIEYKKSEKFTAEESTKLDGQDVWIGIRKL